MSQNVKLHWLSTDWYLTNYLLWEKHSFPIHWKLAMHHS